MTIDERCRRLADSLESLVATVEFREAMTRWRPGELTDMHVSLHSARLSANRLAEAITRVADEAEALIAVEKAA